MGNEGSDSDMTMTTTDTEVTQADRDAAWLFRERKSDGASKEKWDSGFYDSIPIIQAFARHRTLTPAQAAGPVLLEADREDAERWRALISSDRFKMMGAAGFIHEADGSVRVNPDSDYGWLHFGLEVWDRHPAGDDAQGRHGRNLLMAYVEHRRAITQAEGPQA